MSYRRLQRHHRAPRAVRARGASIPAEIAAPLVYDEFVERWVATFAHPFDLSDGIALTATPDGDTLYLGCLRNNARTLVRLSRTRTASRLQAAWQALQTGDAERAEQIFQALTKSDVAPPGAWYGLATLRYRARDFAKGSSTFGATSFSWA